MHLLQTKNLRSDAHRCVLVLECLSLLHYSHDHIVEVGHFVLHKFLPLQTQERLLFFPGLVELLCLLQLGIHLLLDKPLLPLELLLLID